MFDPSNFDIHPSNLEELAARTAYVRERDAKEARLWDAKLQSTEKARVQTRAWMAAGGWTRNYFWVAEREGYGRDGNAYYREAADALLAGAKASGVEKEVFEATIKKGLCHGNLPVNHGSWWDYGPVPGVVATIMARW